MLEMADLWFPVEMTGNRYKIEILIRVMMRISGFVLRRWPRRFMLKVRIMLTRRSSRRPLAVLQV